MVKIRGSKKYVNEAKKLKLNEHSGECIIFAKIRGNVQISQKFGGTNYTFSKIT